MLAMLLLCGTLQDAETRYREALYHEVDKGELDRAIELFAQVEGDARAPETLRARAAFRRAWCLEKKGSKVDAERAYRDIATRYAGQPDVVQKARERLDRLVSGNGGSATTPDQRIAELILQLGSSDGNVHDQATRMLVLIGEPAVPALRQALGHKDVTLSAMAASILVEMGQDSGTYEPLIRGVREGLVDRASMDRRPIVAARLAKLLERQEGYRKDFVETFRKLENGEVRAALLLVLKHVWIPELKDLLLDLLCGGSGVKTCGRVVDALRIRRANELIPILQRLEKAREAEARAVILLEDVSVERVDDEALGQALTWLCPLRTVLPEEKYEMARHNSANTRARRLLTVVTLPTFLKTSGPVWLRSPHKEVRKLILSQLDADRMAIALSLYADDLDLDTRSELLGIFGQHLEAIRDASTRNAIVALLWRVADRRSDVRDTTLSVLAEVVKESDPRWEELLRGLVSVKSESEFEGYYQRRSEEGRTRILRFLAREIQTGEEDYRIRCCDAWYAIRDFDAFKVFAKLAADSAQPFRLRRRALYSLIHLDDPSPYLESLAALVKDRDPDLRQSAVFGLSKISDGESARVLVGLIEDSDPKVRSTVTDYFLRHPRKEYIGPIARISQSHNVALRRSAVSALAGLESLEAVPHLIPRLEDEDAAVRRAARAGLEGIKKHYEEVEQWKRWYEGVRGK